GGALMALRTGGAVRDALQTLGRVKETIQNLDAQTIALWRALSEDVLISLGKADRALELRAKRWKKLEGAEDADPQARAGLAMSAAALAQHAQSSPQDALAWFEAAFRMSASADAARPMLRWAWKHGDYSRLDA